MATTETLSTESAEGDSELGDRLESGDAASDGARPDDARTERASVRVRPEVPTESTGRLWKATAGVGVVSLLAALAVVVLPGTVEFTNEVVRSLRAVALLLGALVGLSGLYVAYHRESGEESDDEAGAPIELPAANPERPHGRTHDAIGTRLDGRLDAIDGAVDDHPETYQAYKIEQSLRGLSVRVVATVADCSMERAREHVEAGTWTDDVRAAAFVGGDEAPERPLQTRVADWASGRPFARQVEATVDELAALMEVDGT